MGAEHGMKILVTGAKGFVGKNLVAELRSKGYMDVFEYDMDTGPAQLDSYALNCDFIFHLAGVNRPQYPTEFMEGNFGFTSVLLEKLKRYGNKSPVLITSSIQADLANPYGQSKKAEEELLFAYGEETGANVLVYRLPNLFGKWCQPNYNSVVATFCHNIANDLDIIVNCCETMLQLVYIDDLLSEFLGAMQGNPTRNGLFYTVRPVHTASLGQIVDLLRSFKDCRATLAVPKLDEPFEKKLYSTYLSYIPLEQLSYPLKMNVDDRGSFTEILRTEDRGQFSVNILKPGVVKGNHWHHTKNEKFVVVSGQGVIRFRNIDSGNIVEHYIKGETIQVVDIPPGCTHNIENTGDNDMITFMWCSECFDPQKPDTIFEKV